MSSVDRLEQLRAILVTQVKRRIAERADRRAHTRERRAQVVRHRAQQRRLDEVAAPQRLGLERLALEARAVDRDREQRRERREEPLLRRDDRIGALGRVERPDARPAASSGSGDEPFGGRFARTELDLADGTPSTLAARDAISSSSSSSRRPRSSSVASSASSAASRSRCSADAARLRARVASSLTTTAVPR